MIVFAFPRRAKLPIDLLLSCMGDETLPPTLRASFCRLLLHIHVDSEPQEQVCGCGTLLPAYLNPMASPKVIAVNYARLWKDIGNLNGNSIHEYDSNTGIFRGAMAFVNQYLMSLEKVWWGSVRLLLVAIDLSISCYQDNTNVFDSHERNKLTLEVVTLARYMIYFGFYDLSKLVELVKRMYVVVDGCVVRLILLRTFIILIMQVNSTWCWGRGWQRGRYYSTFYYHRHGSPYDSVSVAFCVFQLTAFTSQTKIHRSIMKQLLNVCHLHSPK